MSIIPETKFWQNVQKTDTCWLWKTPNQYGYGALAVNGRSVRAHRYSYELHYGTFPAELDVCHRCDNPACVRPDHLFLGTHKANMHDMVLKGRVAVGTHNGKAKLTEDQVLQIRSLYAMGGFSHRQLASRFHVTHTCIGDVIRGKNWEHV